MTIQLYPNITGIITAIVGIIQFILNKTESFEKKYRDKIDAICLKCKTSLTQEIQKYIDEKKDETKNIDAEEKAHHLDGILTKINENSNRYYHWNHLITEINEELRSSVLYTVFVILLSIVYFIKVPDNYSGIADIIRLIALVLQIVFTLNILGVLHKAYIKYPREVDKHFQLIKNGTWGSWKI